MPSSARSSGPAAGAGTWRLGDRTVNRMGFGAMRLTGSRPFHMGEPRDRDTSIAVLRRAVELGVDHIDTAAFYFSRTRSANELINAALSPMDRSLVDDLTIVTKVGPFRTVDGHWGDGGTLRGQVEENLRQLGRERIDVVNFRRGDQEDLRPYVEELAALVDDRLVGHVGVSNVTVEQLEAALEVTDVVCVQNRFAVDAPDDLAVLRRCGELGIAFVPFFAITGTRDPGTPVEPPAVLEVAAEVGATPAQVRLAWTLALGDHVLAIPGTGSVEHLEENVAAAALGLTDEQVGRLGS